MKAKSLAKLRVLVTRPAPQQKELVAAIEAAGGFALHLPMLAINALHDKTAITRLKNRIQNLERYTLLLFVSANAVHYGVDWIEDYWPQLPADLEFFAIGPSTARQLETRLALPVAYADVGMTSEDLLQLPRLNKVAGQRIGIVRGLGGRELLAQTLHARGAIVDYLEVYERRAVEYPQGDILSLIKSNNINVLTVTSGESLARLLQLLGDNKAQLSLIPLLVPSPRVAQQAREAGFSNVIEGGGADLASTLAALADCKAELS